MSTTIVTRTGDTIATRFHGGRAVGAVVQLEITETEMPAWAGVEVAEEGSDRWIPLSTWLAAQSAVVRYDGAARQNALARDLETHRWAAQDGTVVSGMLRSAASDMRRRARDCARQQLRAA